MPSLAMPSSSNPLDSVFSPLACFSQSTLVFERKKKKIQAPKMHRLLLSLQRAKCYNNHEIWAVGNNKPNLLDGIFPSASSNKAPYIHAMLSVAPSGLCLCKSTVVPCYPRNKQQPLVYRIRNAKPNFVWQDKVFQNAQECQVISVLFFRHRNIRARTPNVSSRQRSKSIATKYIREVGRT